MCSRETNSNSSYYYRHNSVNSCTFWQSAIGHQNILLISIGIQKKLLVNLKYQIQIMILRLATRYKHETKFPPYQKVNGYCFSGHILSLSFPSRKKKVCRVETCLTMHTKIHLLFGRATRREVSAF